MANLDPLDQLWTPEQRERGREAARREGWSFALKAMAPHDAKAWPLDRRPEFCDAVEEDFVRGHDRAVDRVAQIVRSLEASGQQERARHLALKTDLPVARVLEILRTPLDMTEVLS